jgi:hypothetical protein
LTFWKAVSIRALIFRHYDLTFIKLTSLCHLSWSFSKICIIWRLSCFWFIWLTALEL